MFDLEDASNPPPEHREVVLWVEYDPHIQEYEGSGEHVIGILRAGCWSYLSHHAGAPKKWGPIEKPGE